MVVVFTGPERSGWVNPFLTTALMHMAFDKRIRLTYAPIHAIFPVSSARNCAVDKFKETDADILVMIDNDIAPPNNVMDAIVGMPPECDIAILPYWVWMPNLRHTMLCAGHYADGVMVTPDPETITEGWNEIGGGGTGFIAMRRRVFTEGKIPEPFFHIVIDPKKSQAVSEDIYFTGNAKEAGYRLFMNADFICNHYHTLNLAEVNAGIVQVTRRFYDVLTEKYGQFDETPESIFKELNPELQRAIVKVREETRRAKESEAK